MRQAGKETHSFVEHNDHVLTWRDFANNQALHGKIKNQSQVQPLMTSITKHVCGIRTVLQLKRGARNDGSLRTNLSRAISCIFSRPECLQNKAVT
jgi:hypothetical protein